MIDYIAILIKQQVARVHTVYLITTLADTNWHGSDSGNLLVATNSDLTTFIILYSMRARTGRQFLITLYRAQQ